MTSAINKVKDFLSSSDKTESTEVCTETAAPVTQEQVTEHAHTEHVEAVDREKHVHHHQNRVQPVAATEHKGEEHSTVVAPEQTREKVTEMAPEAKAKLEQQHNSIQSSSVKAGTERTESSAGTHVNEHTHHHVHEHVQPVIQKETHEHKVTHAIHPVHEKVHEAPVVHETTVLPTKSLDEFQAGVHGEEHGKQSHSHAFFKGEPKVLDKRD